MTPKRRSHQAKPRRVQSRMANASWQLLIASEDARDVPTIFLVHPGQFVESRRPRRRLYIEFPGIRNDDAANAAAASEWPR